MFIPEHGHQGLPETRQSLVGPPLRGGSLAGKPSVPAVLTARPDAISLLKALRRRWKFALGLGILIAISSGALTWFLVPPAKYTARSMFRIATDAPRYIFPTSEVKTDLATYQRTQITMIKSRGVLEKALAQLGDAKLTMLDQRSEPVEWLEKELRVDSSGEILRISLSGTRPDEVTKVVNAVVETYQREVVDRERTDRMKRHDDLKQIYSEYQQRLEKKRKDLRAAAELMGSNDKATLTLKHQYVLERLAMAERELMELQSEMRRAKVELSVRLPPRDQPKIGFRAADPAVEQFIQSEPMVVRLADQVAKLEQAVASVRRVARMENDAVLLRYQRDLAKARRDLETRRAELRAELDARPRGGMLQGPGPDLLKERVAMLEGLERMTSEVVKKLSEEAKNFNHETMGLESLQDEIAHADNAAKRIGDEVEALTVELKAPSRVTLIEKAGPPRLDDEKGPLKLAGLSALGSFLFVLVGVSLYEFCARRIDSVDEVVQGLGMRIMGTLPAVPRRGQRLQNAAREAGWQQLLIESVDAARTMLLHTTRTESHRVVMITSALGGEGKTSLASHLATSLARAGRRTLLLDSDLRSPAAHRLFEVPMEPGFSDFLRGETDLTDVVRPTAVDGLWIIPAGRCNARAIQALAQEEVGAAFEWLKENFDFVVVDSAPVLPVADTLALSQHVDAVLFSILRDVSRMTKVYAAYMRMSELGVRMLGAIVAGARGELYGPEYLYGRESGQTVSAVTPGGGS